jgi:hypothetical protein
MIKSKKGYAILDSAIVMPIIIVTLVFLVYFVSILFGNVLEKSKVDRASRKEAGEKAKTTFYSNSEELNNGIEYLQTNEEIIYQKIIAKNKTKYSNLLFSDFSLVKSEESESTIFIETNFIRNTDFLVNNVFPYIKDNYYGNS